jgi:hypothetical protein
MLSNNLAKLFEMARFVRSLVVVKPSVISSSEPQE